MTSLSHPALIDTSSISLPCSWMWSFFYCLGFFPDSSLVMKTWYVSHFCINIYFWTFINSLILVYYKFESGLGNSSQLWWSIYLSVDQNQGLQFHCNEASQNNQGKNPHVTHPSSSPYLFYVSKGGATKITSCNFTLGTKKFSPWGQEQSPTLHSARSGHPPCKWCRE